MGLVWGCLLACPVPVGGGGRHGSLGFSWEGCCCRSVSQVPDVAHSFILSPVAPSVDEFFFFLGCFYCRRRRLRWKSDSELFI